MQDKTVISVRVDPKRQYIESCKASNKEFIRESEPLIVYARKDGHIEVDDEDVVDLCRQLKELRSYQSPDEMPYGLFEDLVYNSEAISYHRGKPVGVVVLFYNKDGVLMVGWSKCNTHMGDKWNKHVAIYKAEKHTKPFLEALELMAFAKDVVLDTIYFALGKWDRVNGTDYQEEFNNFWSVPEVECTSNINKENNLQFDVDGESPPFSESDPVILHENGFDDGRLDQIDNFPEFLRKNP